MSRLTLNFITVSRSIYLYTFLYSIPQFATSQTLEKREKILQQQEDVIHWNMQISAEQSLRDTTTRNPRID